MAKTSVEILRDLYEETFIDNNTKQITPAKHRAFLERLITTMANGEQGQKADSAVQAAKIGNDNATKEGDTLLFPAYPTSLPNQHPLKIMQNGTLSAEYTGENPISVDVTPEGINAADRGLYIGKAKMSLYNNIGLTCTVYRNGYPKFQLLPSVSMQEIEFIEGTDVAIFLAEAHAISNLQIDVLLAGFGDDPGFRFLDFPNNINWGVTLIPYRCSTKTTNPKLLISGFSFKPSDEGIYRITLNR